MKLAIDSAILLSILSGFTLQLPATIAASYAICVVLFLIKEHKFSFRRKYIFFYSLALFFIFIPTLTLNHEETPLFYLFLSPFLIFWAYSFSRNSIDHVSHVLKRVFWIFVLFIVTAYAIHWDEPEPLGAIFPWASTNGIPSYLIVVQIAYSIAFYLERNRLPLASSSTTMIVAILGLGRGSMAIGAAILLFSFLVNFSQTKRKAHRYIALTFGLLALISCSLLLGVWAEQLSGGVVALIEGSKFASGIFDEHRGRMLADYLAKIDALSFFLGASYDGTSINQDYGGNPHNSFIRLHSFYGLAGLVFFLTPIFLVLTSRKYFAQKIVVSTLVLMALARAATEPLFFPSALDLFYFLYFFIFFRFSASRSKLIYPNATHAENNYRKDP